MSESTDKGKALEQATHAIEEMVLRSHPEIGDGKFTIERNVRFRPHGDLNEIDLIATIRPGMADELRHIFECKNRKEPVSKNDVIIFASKVRDLSAHKGTIVARRFTRDAKARAMHENVELAHFTDEFWQGAVRIEPAARSEGFESIQVACYRRLGSPEFPVPDWPVAICFHNGQMLSFRALTEKLLSPWRATHRKSHEGLVGTFCATDRVNIEFDRSELRIGAWEVAAIQIDFVYSRSIRPARLVSAFSIEKRGRFARFECDPDPFDLKHVAFEFLKEESI